MKRSASTSASNKRVKPVSSSGAGGEAAFSGEKASFTHDGMTFEATRIPSDQWWQNKKVLPWVFVTKWKLEQPREVNGRSVDYCCKCGCGDSIRT